VEEAVDLDGVEVGDAKVQRPDDRLSSAGLSVTRSSIDFSRFIVALRAVNFLPAVLYSL
jgi:hypothetical protein